MAEILIKNMILPIEGEQINITILSDGSVIEHFKNESGTWSSYRSGGVKAIEVPPHGRLIEENKAYDSIMEQTANHYIDMDGVDLGLQNTPTIVEAST